MMNPFHFKRVLVMAMFVRAGFNSLSRVLLQRR
jgi:hypothetical protein